MHKVLFRGDSPSARYYYRAVLDPRAQLLTQSIPVMRLKRRTEPCFHSPERDTTKQEANE
jgi:hypothetical protein